MKKILIHWGCIMSRVSDVLKYFVDHSYDESDDGLKQILVVISNKEAEVCKNYKEISRVIYNMENEEFESLENFFGVKDKQENIFSGLIDSIELKKEDKDNLLHFERHIILSCLQRDYLVEMSDSVSEKVKKTQNKVTKIYSEFVGILGVFTALSFALMGSVQVFGNLLSNVSNPNIRTIGYVLVVAGAYLLLIYLVVSMLFIGMKKVFEGEEKYELNELFTGIVVMISFLLITTGSFMVGL